jgi:serine/threonine protein kinase
MIGTKLAHYEITAHLGSGGMGDVYQATDTKLGRSVAIKFLPEAFSHDTERVARFQREARVLASLNHPNIAAIHGLEEIDTRHFLVMELVPGETLADRIKRGPLPVEEALKIGASICEALEAAHEKGIVHRDLKPPNIKWTPEGKVKVLDFGLAKVREPSGPAANLSESPTLLTRSTPGVIMGTAAYMSPEQAKGKEVDRTTDVWAFGCVVYEMLTGGPVFEGETTGEILGGIFKAEPDWRRLPGEIPEGIRRLLRRCLQKEAKFRLHDMADARIEIAEVQSGIETNSQARLSAGRRERLVWISALALVSLIAVGISVVGFRPKAIAPEMRLDIMMPPTRDPTSLAISPDGHNIVFVGTSENRSRLFLRSLDSVSARPMAGTDFPCCPFWSPDSRSVGFFADNKLKLIDIEGGSVQVLTNVISGLGGTWNRDGTILFAMPQSPIFRVSATGGQPAPATRLEKPQQISHAFPQFLRDGQHFLYHAESSDTRGVYIGQLDGPETRRLLDADSGAVVSSSGQLLVVRQGTLFAQNIDLARLELIGNPFPVAQQVPVTNFRAAVSASVAGPIIYRTGSSNAAQQLTWFDRSGKEIEKLSYGAFNGWSIAPDGHRVALTRNVDGNGDVWLLDLGRGVLSRFTSDPAFDDSPIWSPNGSRIVFSSARKGARALYGKPAASAETEELLLANDQNLVPLDWSSDGRFLLYRSRDPKTSFDIWALPLDKVSKQFPVVHTIAEEREAQFSPDAKWVAYQSNDSGRFEIYVQPFPGPGNRLQISNNGGGQVRWRRDGKELFYIALDGFIMTVPIRLDSNGQGIEAGRPAPLFNSRVSGGAVQSATTQQYAISSDGQRFLVNTDAEETNTTPITVILNWTASLKN